MKFLVVLLIAIAAVTARPPPPRYAGADAKYLAGYAGGKRKGYKTLKEALHACNKMHKGELSLLWSQA